MGQFVEHKQDQTGYLWQLAQVRKDKFWAIHDFYDATNTLINVYFVVGFFLLVYLMLYTVKKSF